MITCHLFIFLFMYINNDDDYIEREREIPPVRRGTFKDQ